MKATTRITTRISLALPALFLALGLVSPAVLWAQARSGNNCPVIAARAAVNLTSSGDNAVIAANPNKRIFVWQWFFVNSHASQDESLILKEGATAISGAFLLVHGGGADTAQCTGTPWAIAPKGSAFTINLSDAGSIKGTLYYTLED